MKRSSEATKARILEAAIEEFAQYGIAGARVDRIAEKASANKRAIYDYFGSKEELFFTVLQNQVGQVTDSVALKPETVKNYPVKLFQFFSSHPEIVRLLLWDGMSSEEGKRPDSGEEKSYYQSKVKTISEFINTQKQLKEDDPRFLAIVLVAIGMSWFTLPQVAKLFLGKEPTRKDRKDFDAYLEKITQRILLRK